MAYVDINEVIATAATVIKESNSTDWNIWKQWCWSAVLNLGISDDDIKVCVLTPKEFSAQLPDDCRQIIEVSLFDENDDQLRHTFRSGVHRIFVDDRIITGSSTTDTTTINQLMVPVDVSSDAHYIHLGTNGDMVNSIVIRYFAYPLDKDGLPMVLEEDVMACVYFIRYMNALRQDDNRSKIAQDQQAWYLEADRARARKKMKSLTPDKIRTLMGLLMSRVPNFRSIQQF